MSVIVAHYLYAAYPEEDEGRLSKRKSQLVSQPVLVRWARELNLGSYLHLGVGEEFSGGRSRPSILADALEALIGALYLDGGYGAASDFVSSRLAREREEPAETDYKSRLQEMLHKRHKVSPDYETASVSGPEHRKIFCVVVRMGQEALGRGEGMSKKGAEQAAAKDALDRLGKPS